MNTTQVLSNKPIRKSQQRVVKKEKVGIQYLRGLAAIMVVLVHIAGWAKQPKYFKVDLFHGLLDGGTVGVELFFVISGFIIVYVSLSQTDFSPLTSTKNFMRKRIERILPYMWLCVLGYAIVSFMASGFGGIPIYDYLRAITLFPVGEVQPKQIWTLRHEFLFYILFCCSILSLKQHRSLLIFWLISPLLWYPLEEKVFNQEGFIHDLLSFVFNKVNLFFLIGVIIGYFELNGRIKLRWRSDFGFLLCFISTIPLFLLSSWTKPNFEENHPFIYVAIIGLTCAAILLMAIGYEMQAANGNLINNLGNLLGDASFSIYLTHGVVISLLCKAWIKVQQVPNEFLLVFVLLSACCAVGIFLHKYVEKPLISWIKFISAPK